MCCCPTRTPRSMMCLYFAGRERKLWTLARRDCKQPWTARMKKCTRVAPGKEEAAAVVSPSGCALPFARCCCIFVTSYPARGPTRRVHSPFTFVRAPLHCSFLNWPMHFAGALLDMASQPAIVAFASPCLLWAITIITIASSLAFPSRRRRRHRDSPSSLGSTFSAVP